MPWCPSTFKSSINNMNMPLFPPLTLPHFSFNSHAFVEKYEIQPRIVCNTHSPYFTDKSPFAERLTTSVWYLKRRLICCELCFSPAEWPHCPQRWINSFLNHPEWQLFMFIVMPNEAWQRNILLEAIKMWGHCQPLPERQRGQSPLSAAVWAVSHRPGVTPPVPASICAPGNASKQYTHFIPGTIRRGQLRVLSFNTGWSACHSCVESLLSHSFAFSFPLFLYDWSVKRRLCIVLALTVIGVKSTPPACLF